MPFALQKVTSWFRAGYRQRLAEQAALRTMAFSRRPPVLLLSALLFGFCVPLSLSDTPLELQKTPVSGRGIEDCLFRRIVAEVPPSVTNVSAGNGSFILAAERTHRKDPADGYKRYTGGWDIKNDHYWTSVAFTAEPLFILAAAWFVLFGLILLLACCCYCCCRRRSYPYSRTAYTLSLILLIMFTCAAIIGCALPYKGQGKFHSSLSKTLDFVLDQANTTVVNLRNFASSLGAAKNIGIDRVGLPEFNKTKVSDLQRKVNSSANTLASRTLDNSDKIRGLLDKVDLILVIIAAVMLLSALLGFLFSIFGLTFLVSILAIVGWILIAGTLILCGVFLLSHNVMADSCIAMDEWVGHPRENTSLDSIIPCADVATANQSLYLSKEYTFKLVNFVNMVIANVSNKNFSPGIPLYYNQSGPLMPNLCNPLMPDLNNRTCITGEVDFSNASQLWKGFVCQSVVVSGSEICTAAGRVTPTMYQQMAAAVNVSQGLYYYGPFLNELHDCSFVRDTFTSISRNQCPDLELYSKWMYIGLVVVSAAVMPSLLFWVIYARERQHRKYNKQLKFPG